MALSKHPEQIIEESKNPLLVKHETWDRIPLGEIAIVQNGFAFKSSSFNTQKKGLPLIRIRDVTKSRTKTYYDGDFNEEYLVSADDLLIGMDGDFNCSRWSGEKALLNQRVCRVIINNDKYDDLFLLYALQPYLDEINKETSSVTVKHLSSKTVSQIPIPLPPLPEQKRIVSRIEELFSKLDAGVAALQHAKTQLKRYRQSVLAAAVTGELTSEWRKKQKANGITHESGKKLLKRILKQRREEWCGKGKYKEPKLPCSSLTSLSHTWCAATIDQVGEVFLGKMLDKKKHKEGPLLPYLRNINIRWGSINTSDLSKMHFKSSELKRYGLKKNDLLVCEGGEPGRAAVWDSHLPELKYQKALHRVRLRLEINPRYIMTCLERDAKTGLLNKRFTGSTIKHFTKQAFIEYEIPLPPLAEQHQIVAEVEARTSAIDHLETELEQQLTRANSLRQSILATAFSGKL